MPASSVKEDYFSVPITALQADGAAYGRSAPATRYRVRIVNTSTTDRVYVAYSSAEVSRTVPYPEVIEADFGVWDSFVDAGVEIWLRASGSSGVWVRMIQFAS